MAAEPELFDVPLEVLHKILYEIGVLSPKDVLNFARACRTAESAAFGAGAEREFNMVQLRAIADPVEMMRVFKKEAGPAFRLGLVRDLYSAEQVWLSCNRLRRYFPPTPHLVGLIEKRLFSTRLACERTGLAILGIVCGRTDLFASVLAGSSDARKTEYSCILKACSLVFRWRATEGMEALSGLVEPRLRSGRIGEDLFARYLRCCSETGRTDLFMAAMGQVDIGMRGQGLQVAAWAQNIRLLKDAIASFVSCPEWNKVIDWAFRYCLDKSMGRHVGDMWLDCPELCAVFVEAGADCEELKMEAFATVTGGNRQHERDSAQLDRLIEFYAGRGQ